MTLVEVMAAMVILLVGVMGTLIIVAGEPVQHEPHDGARAGHEPRP